MSGARRGLALRTSVTDVDGREREAVVVRLDDGLGDVGWGEASPLPGYSPDDLDDVEAAIDAWLEGWSGAGTPPDDLAADPAGDAALAGLPSAACAIDTALLDLAARRLGVPLHARLLDLSTPARPVERLPVAALVVPPGMRSPSEAEPTPDVMGEIARRVAEGYKTIKIKIGSPDFESDLERVARVREAFPYLKIRLDVNGRWPLENAEQHLSRIGRTVVPEFVEQPVEASAMLDFAFSEVPLAADESMRLAGAIEALARNGTVAIVLKPMVLGGPRACVRLAEQAFATGLRVIVSHTYGGRLAHAAACELALALAACDPMTRPPAAGLAGHDDLPQRAGPWVEPDGGPGHGADAPW